MQEGGVLRVPPGCAPDKVHKSMNWARNISVDFSSCLCDLILSDISQENRFSLPIFLHCICKGQLLRSRCNLLDKGASFMRKEGAKAKMWVKNYFGFTLIILKTSWVRITTKKGIFSISTILTLINLPRSICFIKNICRHEYSDGSALTLCGAAVLDVPGVLLHPPRPLFPCGCGKLLLLLRLVIVGRRQLGRCQKQLSVRGAGRHTVGRWQLSPAAIDWQLIGAPPRAGWEQLEHGLSHFLVLTGVQEGVECAAVKKEIVH